MKKIVYFLGFIIALSVMGSYAQEKCVDPAKVTQEIKNIRARSEEKQRQARLKERQKFEEDLSNGNIYPYLIKEIIQQEVLSKLRPATKEDFEQWFCGHIMSKKYGKYGFKVIEANFPRDLKVNEWISYGYDHDGFREKINNFSSDGWFVATEDFVMPPSVEVSYSNEETKIILHIIVPKGVTVKRGKNLKDNQLYFMKDYHLEGGYTTIPLFNDIYSDADKKELANR
ncbi:MAG: hypothetical protein HYW78_01980 [Parcubacteria group bacterium]|nr:hypothetical protein [Parcubacteria group bacterium]